MARLAIFIDGGYVDALAEHDFRIRVDFRKLTTEIRAEVAAKTLEPLDLFRTYYYHCLPYQSNPPTEDEARRFAQKRKFFDALSRLERFVVREGRLAHRGNDVTGKPIFQQKRTDLMLGLDFALLSGKNQITHAAVVAGDSDFIPAFDAARLEGVSIWLFHGPGRRRGRDSTYADELWLASDERYEMTRDFMCRISR